ncbi:MAG: hypothetical protein OEV78_03290 [Spirochaetia bacterium]|nr:hypothetical protein [Spirochaetia bacterium]
MIFYSHWLDFIGKIFSLVAYSLILIYSGISDHIKEYLINSPNPKFFFFIFIGVFAIPVYLYFHRPVVDVFITKLYARLQFGVTASWDESKLLRNLFCLNRKMQWLPMKHVLSLPKEQRLKVLLEEAGK